MLYTSNLIEMENLRPEPGYYSIIVAYLYNLDPIIYQFMIMILNLKGS